jgi:hypothetical protein
MHLHLLAPRRGTPNTPTHTPTPTPTPTPTKTNTTSIPTMTLPTTPSIPQPRAANHNATPPPLNRARVHRRTITNTAAAIAKVRHRVVKLCGPGRRARVADEGAQDGDGRRDDGDGGLGGR